MLLLPYQENVLLDHFREILLNLALPGHIENKRPCQKQQFLYGPYHVHLP